MSDAAPFTHATVLLDEAVASLGIESNALLVDGTFGRGGHSRRILQALGPEGRLLAMDKDPAAIAFADDSGLSRDLRINLQHTSFADLKAQVELLGWMGRVSGVLLDLGVSSPQLDVAERGFSFMRDGPLDMRMNTADGETAAEWLAQVPETELALALRSYGEERFARSIARAIIQRRKVRPIVTTADLVSIIEAAVPAREKGKHPATRSFQAIRIVINRELAELEAVLRQTLDVLKPGGRLAVISFHSLEDRIVKRFMRDEERGGSSAELIHLVQGRPVGRMKRLGKAIKPGLEEIRLNPRARSAVLRVAERVST